MAEKTNLNDLFNFNDLTSLEQLIIKLKDTDKALDSVQDGFKKTFAELSKGAKKAQSDLEKLNPANEGDQKKIANLAKQIDDLTEKINKLKKEEEDLLKTRKKVNQESQKVTEEVKAAEKAAKDLAKAEAQLKQASSATNKEIAALKIQIQQKNKANKEEALLASESIGAYQKQSIQLNNLRKKYKDLIAAQGQSADGAEELLKEINQLDTKLKDIDASVGQFQRNVGNYESALDGIKQGFNNIKDAIGPTALAIAGVTAVISGLSEAADKIGETNKNLAQTATLTGKSGEELNNFTTQVQALASTYDEDFNEILLASNNLAKQFGLSQEQALKLVEDGFIRGANNAGEFLEKIKEYPVQFKNAGLSAEEFINAATVEAQEGVFGDKFLDTIKEAGLRLRELPKATQDALKGALGADFTAELTKGIKAGEITTSEALQKIRAQLQITKPDVVALQTLTADVFGGAGEDVGGAVEALALFDKAINSTDKELNSYQKTQKEQLELNKELEAQQVALSQELQPLIKSFQFFFTKVLTVGIQVVRGIIDGLAALPQFISDNIGLITTLGTVLAVVFSGEIIAKITSLGSAFVGLGKRIAESTIATTALSKAQKISGVINGIVTGQITAQTVAQKALTVAKGIGTKAVKLFNAALRANPIGLVIAGVTALVGVLYLLRDSYTEASDAAKELNKTQKDLQKQNQENIKSTEEEVNRRNKSLAAANANEKKLLEDRKKGLQEIQGAVAEAEADQQQTIEKANKELEKNLAERQRLFDQNAAKTANAAATTVSVLQEFSPTRLFDTSDDTLTGSIDRIDDLNKAIELNQKTIQDAEKELQKLGKESADLAVRFLELENERTKTIKAENLKRTKAEKAQRISTLNDLIASEKIKLLTVEKNSKEELKIKQRLEDLKAALSIESNKKASDVQKRLARETAIANKKALQEQFDTEQFENDIDEIENGYDMLQASQRKALANQDITQKQFDEESIKLEIDRLNKIIAARKDAGEETFKEEAKLAEKERDLIVKNADLIEKDLQKRRDKNLKSDSEFYLKNELALKQSALNDKETAEKLDDILLDEEISFLEDKQKALEEAAKAREIAEAEAFKKSKKLGEEVAKNNKEQAEKDAEEQLKIQKDLIDKKLDQAQRARDKEEAEAAKAAQKRQEREKIIQDAVFERIKREQFARAELLEEQAQNADTEQEREALRKEAAEERAKAEFRVAVIQAFQSSIQSGESVEEALSKVALTAVALQVVGREKGGGVAGGEQLIRINEKGEEFVVDHKTTAAMGLDGASTMADFHKSLQNMQMASMTMGSIPNITTSNVSLSQELNIDYNKLGKAVAANVPDYRYEVVEGKMQVIRDNVDKLERYIVEPKYKNKRRRI